MVQELVGAGADVDYMEHVGGNQINCAWHGIFEQVNSIYYAYSLMHTGRSICSDAVL